MREKSHAALFAASLLLFAPAAFSQETAAATPTWPMALRGPTTSISLDTSDLTAPPRAPQTPPPTTETADEGTRTIDPDWPMAARGPTRTIGGAERVTQPRREGGETQRTSARRTPEAGKRAASVAPARSSRDGNASRAHTAPARRHRRLHKR